MIGPMIMLPKDSLGGLEACRLELSRAAVRFGLKYFVPAYSTIVHPWQSASLRFRSPFQNMGK